MKLSRSPRPPVARLGSSWLFLLGNILAWAVVWLGDSAANDAQAGGLHLAAQRGYVEGIRKLLAQGEDVNGRDERGRTALHYAGGRGNVETIELLLDGKADVNAQDASGVTPLQFAAAQGRSRAAAVLLEHGADITLKNAAGDTAVDVAKNFCQRATLQMLQKRFEEAAKAAAQQKPAAADQPPAGPAVGSPAATRPPATLDMERVLDAAISPDGELLAAVTVYGWTKGAYWNVEDASLAGVLYHGSSPPRGWFCLAFSPDSQFLAVGGWMPGTVSLFQVPTQVRVRSFTHTKSGSVVRHGQTAETWPIHSVAFSPDGNYLAAGVGAETGAALGSDGEISVWDVKSGNLLHKERTGNATVVALDISKDGRYLVANGPREGDHGQVIVWDFTRMKRLRKFSMDRYEDCKALAISPTEPWVAAAGKYRVIFWNLDTGEEIRSIKTSVVNSLEFSPDGTRLASGSQAYGLHVWDVATGRDLWNQTVHGRSPRILSVSYHPDGKHVAAAFHGGRVELWDTESGNRVWSVP